MSPSDTVLVIDEEQATKPPRLIAVNFAGGYPTGAKERQIGGYACVRFVILETGKADPATIEFVRLSELTFRASAIRIIRGSEFEPGELDGRRVRVRVKQAVRWQIDDAGASEPGRLTSACS